MEGGREGGRERERGKERGREGRKEGEREREGERKGGRENVEHILIHFIHEAIKSYLSVSWDEGLEEWMWGRVCHSPQVQMRDAHSNRGRRGGERKEGREEKRWVGGKREEGERERGRY